jgi:hypothetical protein
MMDRKRAVLILAKAARAAFDYQAWMEIGFLTDSKDIINSHHRLMISLEFGDDDYETNVVEVLAKIVDSSDDNFKVLAVYKPIVEWLTLNDERGLRTIHAEIHGVDVMDISMSGSKSAIAALEDARQMLQDGRPMNAVDRIHTVLHGYLLGACREASIPFAHDATAHALLRLLLEKHRALQKSGPNGDLIRSTIRTGASIVESMGTLRNNASLAHPKEALLGYDEALLMVSMSQSLLRFLDAKIHPSK